MKRRVVGVVAAVLLAAAGTFVLMAWVRAAEDRALAGESTADVLVVIQPVAKGTAAADIRPLVSVERVPVKVRAADGVTDLAELEGKVAAVDLVPGEQLLADRFVDPNVLAVQGDIEIPADHQQVTIALDPQRAVGGRLMAGDTVGVFASFDDQQTHLILHKVLVSHVQGGQPPPQPAAEGEAPQAASVPDGGLLVTFAVDAAAAERIVFAAEHGSVWLSSQPNTAREDGTTIQTRETIYQ